MSGNFDQALTALGTAGARELQAVANFFSKALDVTPEHVSLNAVTLPDEAQVRTDGPNRTVGTEGLDGLNGLASVQPYHVERSRTASAGPTLTVHLGRHPAGRPGSSLPGQSSGGLLNLGFTLTPEHPLFPDFRSVGHLRTAQEIFEGYSAHLHPQPIGTDGVLFVTPTPSGDSMRFSVVETCRENPDAGYPALLVRERGPAGSRTAEIPREVFDAASQDIARLAGPQQDLSDQHRRDVDAVKGAGDVYRALERAGLTLKNLSWNTLQFQGPGDPAPVRANWRVDSDPHSGPSLVVSRAGAEQRFPITGEELKSAMQFQRYALERAQNNPFTKPAAQGPAANFDRKALEGRPARALSEGAASVPPKGPTPGARGTNANDFRRFLGATPSPRSASAPAPRARHPAL